MEANEAIKAKEADLTNEAIEAGTAYLADKATANNGAKKINNVVGTETYPSSVIATNDPTIRQS